MRWYEVHHRRADVGDEDDDASWTVLPLVSEGSQDVELSGLERGVTYDVRVRMLDAEGRVVSPWSSVRHVHEFDAPAPVDVVDLAVTDGDCLTWRMPLEVEDLAGFEVRSAQGAVTAWDAMEPAHEGLWPSSPFPLCAIAKGERAFAVVAVTKEGGRSAAPAAIVVDRGPLDDALANELHAEDKAAANFPGSLAGGIAGAGVVTAALSTRWRKHSAQEAALWRSSVTGALWVQGGMWRTQRRGGEALWRSGVPDALWRASQRQAVVYETHVDVPLTAAGPGVRLTLDLAASIPGVRVEHRTTEAMWRRGRDVPWRPRASSPWWRSRLEAAAWRPWPGRIEDVQAGRHDFRVTLPGAGEASVLSAFAVRTTTASREEVFTALAVSAAGTRLPIAAPYREIQRVKDLVVRAQGAAIAVLVADLDPFLGPLLYCVDAADAFCAGTVDATVVGY